MSRNHLKITVGSGELSGFWLQRGQCGDEGAGTSQVQSSRQGMSALVCIGREKGSYFSSAQSMCPVTKTQEGGPL